MTGSTLPRAAFPVSLFCIPLLMSRFWGRLVPLVQTMSKSRALAGLRVGYAIGDAGLNRGADPGENKEQRRGWPQEAG
jgi:hypothetical protein